MFAWDSLLKVAEILNETLAKGIDNKLNIQETPSCELVVFFKNTLNACQVLCFEYNYSYFNSEYATHKKIDQAYF